MNGQFESGQEKEEQGIVADDEMAGYSDSDTEVDEMDVDYSENSKAS